MKELLSQLSITKVIIAFVLLIILIMAMVQVNNYIWFEANTSNAILLPEKTIQKPIKYNFYSSNINFESYKVLNQYNDINIKEINDRKYVNLI